MPGICGEFKYKGIQGAEFFESLWAMFIIKILKH